MASTMNFRCINKFNIIYNAISGNFFPLTEDDAGPGLVSGFFLTLVWLIELIYLSSTTIGMLTYIPPMVALQIGGVQTIVTIEMVILSVYLHSKRDFLRRLIHKINIVLIDSDDLRQYIRRSVEPRMNFLKRYSVPAVGSTILWAGMPILKVFDTDQFTCYDYTVPSYIPGCFIATKAFVGSIIIEIIGAAYIVLKKIGIDVYTTYLITLVTAEYRYLHRQIVDALGQENEENDEERVIFALRKIVRHQYIVMEIGQMLTQLLSVNVGLIYLNCILRFCLLGFSLVTISGAYFQKFLYVMYAMGALSQVYSFCLCVHELHDASTSVTSDAFHQNWYGRGYTVKRLFHMIGLSNSMECRLTAFRIVDLTVPSFASVLNQAYSACLLLIKIY